MVLIKNILSALTDFLNEAQSIGIIQEFTLIPREQVKEDELSKVDELLSNFLDKLRCASVCAEKNMSSTEVTKEEKQCKDKVVECPVEKDSVPMQVDANEVCTESSSSSVTEQIEITEQEKKLESCSSSESSLKENLVQMQDTMNKVANMEDHSIRKNLVQIQVDTNEMKRRIAAFISRKRKEVDEWNVQEFCGRTYFDEQDPAWEQSDSCARVDAVFVPRRGSKSHIKVSRVKNVWGPQTQLQSEAKKIKQEPCEMENQSNDASLQAIEERLSNMESHLKLKSDNSLRSSIFQRLKDLENRILLLESTSPEYIQLPNSDFSPPRKKNNFDKEKIYLNCDADELRKRMQSLKESFKAKSLQIKTEPIF